MPSMDESLERVGRVLAEAQLESDLEELDHTPWVVLRWLAKQDRTDPEVYGPFVTIAEALACAEIIERQMNGALMGPELMRTYGEQTIRVLPMDLDYMEGSSEQ